MKRTVLADHLRKLADLVESGDISEGNVEWLLGETPEDVSVNARIRIGSLQGQRVMGVTGSPQEQEVMGVIEEAPEPDRRSILLDIKAASIVTAFDLGIEQALTIVQASPDATAQEIEHKLSLLLPRSS